MLKYSHMITDQIIKEVSQYIDENLQEDFYVCAVFSARNELEDALETIEEGFSPYLLSLIKEKGLSEVDCYKKAHASRQLFSKIRSNADYQPTKETAIAFALALHLSLEETDNLLERAGFSLSHSSKADLIVEYFIKHEQYDLLIINEALDAFSQPLIRC